jgi:hypothetical protein
LKEVFGSYPGTKTISTGLYEKVEEFESGRERTLEE